MFRTVLLILSGNAGGALLSLVRNLLIARLLPVEQYGIAATFAMAMSVIEMLSTIGMQQQIVQSKDGSNPHFQATLHGFNLVRGVISAAVLFFSAYWIAAFLGIPEVAWAYQLLALVPLFNGLLHYDIHRLKRQMVFGPEIVSQVAPHALALALVWPLYQVFPDFRLMLALILVQFSCTVIASHLMAERRFDVGFDRTIIAGAVRFGWPLLINNVLLFLVFNGEKLIVGRELGMADLGILAMGFTLTLTPTLVLGRSVQAFFLPQLSAVRDDPARFGALFLVVMQGVFLALSVLLVIITLVLPALVDWVLGAEYTALLPLILWLGILQMLRSLKIAPSVAAVATGFTTNPMLANSVRVISLPLAWVAAVYLQDMLAVILVAIAGEGVGLIISLWLLNRRLALPLRSLTLSALMVALVTGACIVQSGLLATGPGDLLRPGWINSAVLLALLGVSAATMGHLWNYIRNRHVYRFTEEDRTDTP